MSVWMSIGLNFLHLSHVPNFWYTSCLMISAYWWAAPPESAVSSGGEFLLHHQAVTSDIIVGYILWWHIFMGVGWHSKNLSLLMLDPRLCGHPTGTLSFVVVPCLIHLHMWWMVLLNLFIQLQWGGPRRNGWYSTSAQSVAVMSSC